MNKSLKIFVIVLFALGVALCFAGDPTPAQLIKGTVTANQGLAGTNAWKIDFTNFTNITVNVGGLSITNSVLPTGASTSALQLTGNGFLSNILNQFDVALSTRASLLFQTNGLEKVSQAGQWGITNLFLLDSTFTGRINTFGQKTMANSTPVVLASDQSSLAVTVGNFPATQAITGLVSVANFPSINSVTGSVSILNFPSDQLIHGPVAITNVPAVTVSGSVGVTQGGPFQIGVTNPISISNFPSDQLIHGPVAVTNTPSVAQSGTWNIGTVAGGNIAVTNTVATLAAQSGAWTIAVSNFPATQVVSGQIAVTNDQTIHGAVTVTNVPSVAQSGPWSIVGVSNVFGTVTITGGVAASQSGAWQIGVSNFPSDQLIHGPVAITNTPAVTVSGSVGVTQSGAFQIGVTNPVIVGGGNIAVTNVISSAQSGTWNVNTVSNVLGTINILGTVGVSNTVAISAASLPLPSGAATSALQSTGIVFLTSIDSKTPALGQTNMAASLPVVIASNQSAVPVSQSGTWVIGSLSNVINTVGVTGSVTATEGGTWTIAGVSNIINSVGVTQAGPFQVAVTNTPSVAQSGIWNIGTLTTISNIVGTISLPTGAATEATATNGNQKSQIINSAGVNLGTTNTPMVVTLGNVGKTAVMKHGTLTSTATTADQVVLTYTVTSGKTFYLQYLTLYVKTTAVPVNNNTPIDYGAISLETPSGTKVITDNLSQGSTFGWSRQNYFFAEAIPITTNVVRVVTTPTAATSFFWESNFGGYEK